MPGAASAATAANSNALPPGLTAVAAARLDSGNAAFRARQYAAALKYYRAATRDVPEHPAPWYGIYMVAAATNNRLLADSATSEIERRDGGGDLLKSGMADTHKGNDSVSGLPPDHPAIKPRR